MSILMSKLLIVVAFTLATGLSYSYRHRRPEAGPGVFEGFWSNIRRTFRGPNAVFYLLAVGLTLTLVLSGTERTLQDIFQAHALIDLPTARWFLHAGEFWTPITAAALLAIALARRDRLLRGAAAASLQAVLATFLVSTLLKGATGRRGPLRAGAEPGSSHLFKTTDHTDFAFDIWNRVVGDGRFFWPSGHTASTAALVAALVAYFPEHRWLAWVGYPLILLMGLAMIEGDFHWVSDVIAGALIGHVIGWTIGKRFRNRP